MLDLTLHDQESVPEGSAEAMAGAKERFGFVPNVIAYLANAPAAVMA